MKKKLQIFVLFLSAVFIVFLVGAIFNINNKASLQIISANNMNQEIQLKRFYLAEMNAAARERTLLLMRMFHEKDVFERDELKLLLSKQAGRVNESILNFQKLILPNEQADNFEIILADMIETSPKLRLVSDLLLNEKDDEAKSLIFETIFPNQDAIIKYLHSFNELVHKENEENNILTQSVLTESSENVQSLTIVLFIFIAILFFLVKKEFSQRERALINQTKAFKESDDINRNILNTTPDAIINFNQKGVIKIINGAACRLLSYDEADILSANITKLSIHKIIDNQEELLTLSQIIACTSSTALMLKTALGSLIPIRLTTGTSSLLGQNSYTCIFSDQRKFKITEQLLMDQKQALDQHSLVSMTDLKGNILSVNKKFSDISGYSIEELIGQNHRLLNSSNQSPDYWKAMYLAVSKEGVWHDEVCNKTKNGNLYWVDTTIVPNYNIHGKLSGYTSIRTDITKAKENISNLAIAKEAAEIASVSKADFLANMSHEIRTPMNGVIGMTNLLLDSHLTKEQYKLAKTVKSSGEGLLGIINDILDFSKIEAGKIDLEYLNFNLGKMIEDLGSTLVFQADNKGLQFICPATPVINQWVIGDPGRLRQILTNLISNAIKFTDQGEVAVYVTIEENINRKKILFEIKDSGIGITPEQQNKLFIKFSQADTSTTRKYGGTGLGLSISKKLVELMGGEIGIKSTYGQGSNFWFKLDLESSEKSNNEILTIDNIDKQKVLIVDDNATNRDLMHKLHDIWGIPHTLVSDGKSALNELKLAADTDTPYTLALLDMSMPEMDGLGLSQHIHAHSSIKDIKLIMVTSQAQRGDAKTVKEAGFNGYLTKPIHQSALFDIIVQVSGLKDGSNQLVTRFTSREKYQFKGHILIVEDNPTNQLVIEGLLTAFGLTVDLASNGEEALSALKRGQHHDLVLMDCQMPIMDGYIATSKIRDPKTKLAHSNIPIIAMTANAMIGDKEKCLSVGMNDYISKPIDPEKVAAILEKWLPESTLKSIADESINNTLSSTKNDVIVFDYDDMSSRLMHQPELMKVVAQQFYIDLNNFIEELKVAVDENDTKQIVTIGHKIKGTAANIGGLHLSALALKIELASKANDMEEVSQLFIEIEASASELIAIMKEKL